MVGKRFLLEWPIFRCKLLVSGRVTFPPLFLFFRPNWHVLVTKTRRWENLWWQNCIDWWSNNIRPCTSWRRCQGCGTETREGDFLAIWGLNTELGGGFKDFFIFTRIWGDDPIWLIFFRWVETTNWQMLLLDLTKIILDVGIGNASNI